MGWLHSVRSAARKAGALFLVLFCGLMVSACGGDAPDEAPAPIRPARLIEITAQTDVRQISLPAVIEAAETADLTFQVGGLLSELLVIEGQEVSKGDVLARLDPRDYQNAADQANAQFDAAQSEFDRANRLLAQDAISRSIFEQRRSARDVAKAALDSAQKALEDTVLLSPFDGIVATVHIDQFQNVAPQAPIATIQTIGAAEALVQIPATMVAYSGRITPVETIVSIAAAPDVKLPAELLSVSTQADPATQTFAVRFGFTPPEDLLILPGMAGTVRATLAIGADVGSDVGAVTEVTVPLGAVLSEGEDQFVWLVDIETMTVSKRSIELGVRIGEQLPVTSGLEAGDTIVGAGASYLFEGMKIRPYEG